MSSLVDTLNATKFIRDGMKFAKSSVQVNMVNESDGSIGIKASHVQSPRCYATLNFTEERNYDLGNKIPYKISFDNPRNSDIQLFLKYYKPFSFLNFPKEVGRFGVHFCEFDDLSGDLERVYNVACFSHCKIKSFKGNLKTKNLSFFRCEIESLDELDQFGVTGKIRYAFLRGGEHVEKNFGNIEDFKIWWEAYFGGK